MMDEQRGKTVQTNVTRLLQAVRTGDRQALHDLFPLVYDELRAQAQWQRRRWHGNRTVNTTALVHEAYLKLVDQTQVQWQSRAHFLGVASKAMRHILIDYARYHRREKRGGDHPNVPLHAVPEVAASISIEMSLEKAETLIALDEALDRLKTLNERQSNVIECRFFGGMTIPDTAEALGISPATVKRDWGLAQAWLYREMSEANSR
jgi:RNA polymerase sigma factor (TIGR02999 family)